MNTPHGLAVALLFFVLLPVSRAEDAGPSDKTIDGWLSAARPTIEERVELRNRYVESRLLPLPHPQQLDAWKKERESLRGRLIETLGLAEFWPAREPTRSRVTGTLQRDGYRIEKLWFEGYPGQFVPALLYVPEGVHGRMPGIVSLAGHVYGLGKAAEFLQQRNVNLVKRGCVVLAYDYLGCGERNTGPDPFHDQPYGGGNDHGLKAFSFSRKNPTGLELLDALRAVDLLVARDDVDPERIGFTGESGGGNSTYWASALDERIKLSVPVACLTSYDYWIRHDRNWDWHQRPFGVRAYADIGTLLALHAPRPLVAISSLRGTDDEEFPLEEAEKSIAWARQVYRLYDHDQALAHHDSSTPHGYQEDKRQTLYLAVEQWLRPPQPQGKRELPAAVETFETLMVGLPRESLTNIQIYYQWASGLPRAIDSAPRTPEEVAQRHAEQRRRLRRRLGWPEAMKDVIAERTGDDKTDGVVVEFWRLATEPGMACPALLVLPKGPPSGVTIVVDRRGEVVRSELNAGRAVLLFTPRGMFEDDDGGRPFRNFAWFFGKPVAGQRALDLAQASRWLRTRLPDCPVRVSALGPPAWVALLAAAAEQGTFDGGDLTLPFRSQRWLVDRGNPLADVPGLLEYVDVPQLSELWPHGAVRLPE